MEQSHSATNFSNQTIAFDQFLPNVLAKNTVKLELEFQNKLINVCNDHRWYIIIASFYRDEILSFLLSTPLYCLLVFFPSKACLT